MRTAARALSVLVLAVLIGGCAQVEGSGNVVSESRDVSGITALEFGEDGDLLVEQTGTESLTITADDNLLPYLKSEVRGGRLIIGNRDGINLRPSTTIVVKLTVRNLNAISLSGDGTIDARGINSDQLRISVSGDGRIEAAGNAETQEIKVSGDGSYAAEQLTSKVARVQISGDGKAVLAVTEKLDASISGDGSVEYTGNPAVTQNISGDGSVRKR